MARESNLIQAIGLLMTISSFFGFSQKSDPDQQVLEQLKKAGSNLSKPHQIEFFLYFPTQSAAQQVAEVIEKSGFTVTVKPAAKGPNWLCFATKAMVPELSALQKIRKDFDTLSKANHGEYDGWGTSIVR